MAVTNRATIDHTQVDTPHEDFVVAIQLSEMTQSWWDLVKSNGGDIRVFTAGGTEVAREVVAIDKAAQTGVLMWRSSGLSTGTNTAYDIEVDGSRSEPAPGASNGRNSVWPTGSGVSWVAVHHMEEDPSGTDPAIQDSTANGNDLTTRGSMTSADSVSGVISKGLQLDGSDDVLWIDGAVAGFDTQSHTTVYFWYRPDQDPTSAGQNYLLWGSAKPDNENEGHTDFRHKQDDGSGDGINAATDGGNTGGNRGTFPAGSWHHTGFSYSQNNDTIRLFEDGGVLYEDNSYTDDYPYAQANLYIGANWIGGSSFNQHTVGSLDEHRMANTVISSSWITTDYNNQNDPTTSGFFASVEEPVQTVARPAIGPQPEHTRLGISGSPRRAYPVFARTLSAQGSGQAPLFGNFHSLGTGTYESLLAAATQGSGEYTTYLAAAMQGAGEYTSYVARAVVGSGQYKSVFRPRMDGSGSAPLLNTFGAHGSGRALVVYVQPHILGSGSAPLRNTFRADGAGTVKIVLRGVVDALGRYSISLTVVTARADGAGRMPIAGPFASQGAGLYRSLEDALARWELYVGVDQFPDLDRDPDETWQGAFGHTSSTTLDPPASGSTDYYLVVLPRNDVGRRAQPVWSRKITVNADGTTDAESPATPDDVRLVDEGGGSVGVRARWERGGGPGDEWVLWHAVGGDPDTSTAPAEVVGFPPPAGKWLERLRQSIASGASDGDTVHVAVGVRESRTGAQAVASVQTITVSVAGLSSTNEEAFAGGEARLA